MKGHNSCLFPIFQIMFAEIAADNFPLTSPISNIAHLERFVSDINQDHSETGYYTAISKAVKDSNQCNLCSICTKCSKLFYLSVAEIKVSNFNSTALADEKKLIETTYGKLSFRQLPQYLKHHFDNHNDLWKKYQLSIENNKHRKAINDNLIILKGMSSSSPYIYNGIYSTKHFTGGGIYLRINNYGIVIDPGYGFVENMRKFGIGIQDIDAIIITHHHIDHTSDMRIIDDLNHQFQKRHHIIDWYIDETTNRMLYHGYDPKINRCHIIEPALFNSNVKIRDDVSFVPFKTEHIVEYHEERSTYNNQTFGIVLNLNFQDKRNLKLGYTSDTRYYKDMEKNLVGCDIIVANISGIYYEDYLLLYQKDKHLGYRGCYNILKGLSISPKLFIVSEFWNGTTDLRFDICKALSKDLNDNIKIIPGDIGLQINIKTSEIKCSKCGNYCNISDIYSIRPSEEFSDILYVCKECLL